MKCGLFVVAAILLSLQIGCRAQDPIPTYPPMSAAESLALMQKRASRIETVSGDGSVTLSDQPNGRSIRLDSAFVFAPPDRARLRAWKFGQAVFDLTILPDEVWLYSPRGDSSAIERLRNSSKETGRSIRQWLSWQRFDVPLEAIETSSETFRIRRPLTGEDANGATLECVIDRRTLTARTFTIIGASGERQFRMSLSEYRVSDLEFREGPSPVWPLRIEAVSPRGNILVQIDHVDWNNAPPNALKPSPRAEKLP